MDADDTPSPRLLERALGTIERSGADICVWQTRHYDERYGGLREGMKLMLSAPSKAGKTWCMIELGCSVTTGKPWLGRDCKQGRVLYANFEVAAGSFMWRVRNVADAMQCDISTVEKNLDVWHLRGHVVDMEKFTNGLLRRVESGARQAAMSAQTDTARLMLQYVRNRQANPPARLKAPSK